MIYCYLCETCAHKQQVWRPIGTAPEFLPCESCGDPTSRDYSTESAGPAAAQIKNDSKYPYVSNRLPANLDGCPADPKGKPVILSKRHEAEIMARYNYGRE